MSKIADAIVKHFRSIRDPREEILLDRNWVTKILYERRDLGWRTDIERDVIFTAEGLEPDKEKWASQEEYQEAMAELRKKYPRMQ